MKQKEILSQIKYYATTGHIGQALLPLYDQHGRWLENVLQRQIKIPDHWNKLMRETRLPTSRRVSHGPNGGILHTSYTADSYADVNIEFREIRGNLIITKEVSICAPHLEFVGGDCVVINCNDFDSPMLGKVGGDLLISDNLPAELVTVGGNLTLYDTDPYNAEKLKSVGKTFMVLMSSRITTPALEKIGNDFLLDNITDTIIAPRLISIGGNFKASHARVIDMYRLRNVGGDMHTSSANQYYHPDIKLGGVWMIEPDAMMNWNKRKKALELLRMRETPYLW